MDIEVKFDHDHIGQKLPVTALYRNGTQISLSVENAEGNDCADELEDLFVEFPASSYPALTVEGMKMEIVHRSILSVIIEEADRQAGEPK